ncbi:polyprenyl synthetase family protein [archaeon]|nr:polyprenyl synthetase family protein [archaeon]
MDIEKIMAEKSHLIDKEFEAVLKKDEIENLHDAIWYHMSTGGKRIRPLLAILTCEALSGDSKKIIPFAAACELLHNWLLIHDDIEDGDRVRRDLPTVWVKYGMPHAVNVGDYLAQKVYELIIRSKNYNVPDDVVVKLIDAMITTSLKTSEGQSMDMNLRNNESPTETEYISMAIHKTAYYLTVPMIGAAIVSDREDLVDKIVDFGMNIGPAFQITDDVLDLTEGKGRQEIGRDIKEGKRSILVVHCLSKCAPSEKEALVDILNKTPEDTSDNDVLLVKEMFEKHGSIDYAVGVAKKYADKAKTISDDMPDDLRSVLDFFADYIVKRRK